MLNFSTLLPPGHQILAANEYESLLVVLAYLIATPPATPPWPWPTG